MTQAPEAPAEFKAYPSGDPVAMTGSIGQPYETVNEKGEPVGIAEHIVAVTGVVDEVGDVFVPGSFIKAMSPDRVRAKGVSGHDWGTKVSKALVREEWLPGDPRIAEKIIPNLPEGKSWPKEAGAVYVKAQYNLNTPEGRRAYENAKFYGAEECFSVGYKVRPGGAKKRGNIRYITDHDWYEWSDVLHGANSLAFGLSVKGLLESTLEYSGGHLATETEVKARYVRDSAFWGLPVGTPIRPGMKPRGPKALRLRRQGEVPDPDQGTTTKKPTGDPAKDKKAPLAPKGKPDPGLFDEPERQTVRATATKPVDAYGDDTIAEIVEDLATAPTVGQRPKSVEERDAEIESLLEEGLTPDEVGDLLRDSPNWGAAGPNEDAIDEFVAGYGEEYQRRAREQRNIGTPPGVEKSAAGSRDDAIFAARQKADGAYARDDVVALAEALQVLFEGDPNAPDADEEAERISIMSQSRALDMLDDHTTAARERAGIDLNPNEKTEDDKLRRAEFEAAKREAPARPGDEPTSPEPAAAPAEPDDLQARMDALKAEGRDNEAAKLYAEERRKRRAGGSAQRGELSTPLATEIRDAIAATPDSEPLGNRLTDAAPEGQAGIVVRGTAASINNNFKRTRRGSSPAKRVSPEESAQRSQRSFKLNPQQMNERADGLEALAEALEDLDLGEPDQGDGFGSTAEYARRTAAAYRQLAGGGAPGEASGESDTPTTGDAEIDAKLQLPPRQYRQWVKEATPEQLDKVINSARTALSKMSGRPTDRPAFTRYVRNYLDPAVRERDKRGDQPKQPAEPLPKSATDYADELTGTEAADFGSLRGAQKTTYAHRRNAGDDHATAMRAARGESAPAAIEEHPVDQRIFDALAQLLPKPGDWARLTDLRDQLADVDRAELDARLKKLGREQRVTLAPNPNGKDVTPADREAAVMIGGDQNHLISVDELPERPEPDTVDDDESEADLGSDEPISEDELLSEEDVDNAAALADDALGLIEADDGELEVTPEVAERQDRVEALLEQGDDAITNLDDTQLTDARRDVADELALQDELARRDARSRRQTPPPTDGPAETPAGADAGTSAGEGEGETAGSEPAADAAPAGPKTRPGLAGAAEDLADALDSGDEDAIARTRARLESSLRRSRSESEHAQALRDMLAGDGELSADDLRTRATAMRDEARARRNEQARNRRLAKRLERERLRSLLGQIDAEMRNRGLAAPNEDENGDKIGPTAADQLPTDVPASGDALATLDEEDLAAARALTEPAGDQSEPPESPVATPEQPPAPEAAPELEPVTGTMELTGLPEGQWTDTSDSPVRVAGQFYEASIEPSTTRPGEFEYSFRVMDPAGGIASIGSGRADSIADAQRFVVADLSEAFQGYAFRGMPADSMVLPDAPPEPSETERAETIYTETALKRQGRDDVNPITGEQDYSVPPPMADKPLGTKPFRTVEEVQDHLETVFAGKRNPPQWDTGMLSAGGGLIAVKLSGTQGYTVLHTGSGASVSSVSTTLGQKDARDFMDALERLLGPNGRQVDWTAPTAAAAEQSITDAGFKSGSDVMNAANAAIVGKRVARGDYSSALVKDAARAAAVSTFRLHTKFPNWETGNKRLTNNMGGLELLLNGGRAKRGDSRSAEEIADDRATLQAAKGAENLLRLGAPDKAIAVIERRADELEAKYGRGASPYDVTTGGASARGSVMLRRMADTMRQMVTVSPQGVDALRSAQPGDRFMIIDQSPVPGNPNMDPKKSYRTFTITSRSPRTSQYDFDTSFNAVEDNAPNNQRDGAIRLSVTDRGDEPQVSVPRWVEGTAANTAIGRAARERGPVWVTVGEDRHSYKTTRVAKLAPNEQLPETFDDALNRVGVVTREPRTEAAIADARRAIDDNAGEIDTTQAPKARAASTRGGRRAGGRGARPAEVAPPAQSRVPQAVLDTQQRNTAALVGGPIPLTDTAPEGPFTTVDEVRRAWARGVMSDGGPMDPQAAAFANARAGDDAWWNGMQLSPGGWFLVQPNGQVTHAETSRLVTGRTGGLPTQATAMRYADMLERITANGQVVDWSGDGSRAPVMMREAGLTGSEDGKVPSIARRIATRAALDEGNNPKAVKAVLAGRNQDVSESGVTPIILDTGVWGRAFDPGRSGPGYSSDRHYLGRKPSVTWPVKADEKKSEELRKLLAWADAMSTASPYTVATELRRWQDENADVVLKFQTSERVGNYDRKLVDHEVRPADIVDEIASKLERAADPSQRTEPEKLAANKGGTVQIANAHAEVDRLVSDNDTTYAARQAQVERIQQMIINGGAQIRYDDMRRKWVAELPGVSEVFPGQSAPLRVLTVVPYATTEPGHISDEVVLTDAGGIRLRFRAQPTDDIYTTSIVRVDIPPGSWTVAEETPTP